MKDNTGILHRLPFVALVTVMVILQVAGGGVYSVHASHPARKATAACKELQRKSCETNLGKITTSYLHCKHFTAAENCEVQERTVRIPSPPTHYFTSFPSANRNPVR